VIQARNYTPTNGRQIDLVVLHSMEAPEKPATAENIAGWFAGATAPRASAHWCHDDNSSVRCVPDRDVAWHAPGANHNGIGHEMAGYARQSSAEWLDPYSRRMLARVAAQVRVDCDTYDIPRRFVAPGGLRRGDRGITIHRYVSEAFNRSTHWDTGYHFPEDHFLALVADAAPTGPTPAPGPVAGGRTVLRRGTTGPQVAGWQRILAGAGHRIAVDGSFGPDTETATRAFQRQLGVEPDGIVGPATHEATARLLAWLAAQRPILAVPPFAGTVRRGSTGPAVRAVQARLRARGWRIAVDGIYGPDTEAIVRRFQTNKGLTIDGITGYVTWRVLWTAPVTPTR
jgi:peptidoglycan hydrolase-like protein with peptidoglycan-binding domain